MERSNFEKNNVMSESVSARVSLLRVFLKFIKKRKNKITPEHIVM